MQYFKLGVLLGWFLAVTASPLFAQGLVVTPPAAQEQSGTDYARLIEQAYPRYESAVLADTLLQTARTLENRPDQVTVRTLTGIEQVMQLSPSTSRQAEVDTPLAYYRIEPALGRAQAQRKNNEHPGMAREQFSATEAAVKDAHQRFLLSLGLPQDELMKVEFRKIMVQSLQADSSNNSDGSPPIVRRGVTLAYRGLGGFPIEESLVRVTSYDASQIQDFALKWPRFKLHPELQQLTLDDAANVKRAILQRVSTAVTQGKEVRIAMGVVFRPAKTIVGDLVYLPAMKVVVTPNAKRVADTSGSVQTDAGLVFYADLLRTAPQIAPDDLTDR